MSRDARRRIAVADAMLAVTAAIWGFAFVAQRSGMEHVGPFTFNAARFALGAAALIPVSMRLSARRGAPGASSWREVSGGGALAGVVLFAGSSFQQVGLVHTTAGKAGFVTGLYVLLVPLAGLAIGRRPPAVTLAGAALATLGLYALAGVGRWTETTRGDALVLAGAFCWAAHVLVIERLAARHDALRLAVTQFAVCAALSAGVALATEPVALAGLRGAAIPIAYAGLGSVGIAYTLQVVAQRHAPAAHAAILMSAEAVFAAVGGAWLLGERMTRTELAGAGLMLAGIVLSQISVRRGARAG